MRNIQLAFLGNFQLALTVNGVRLAPPRYLARVSEAAGNALGPEEVGCTT